MYKTSNMALAAFLLSLGCFLDGTSDGDGKVIFHISGDNITGLVDDFYGDSKVPAMKFWNALRTLKSRIWESRNK